MRKLNVGFYTFDEFFRHWTQEMEREDVCVCVHMYVEGRRGKIKENSSIIVTSDLTFKKA